MAVLEVCRRMQRKRNRPCPAPLLPWMHHSLRLVAPCPAHAGSQRAARRQGITLTHSSVTVTASMAACRLPVCPTMSAGGGTCFFWGEVFQSLASQQRDRLPGRHNCSAQTLAAKACAHANHVGVLTRVGKVAAHKVVLPAQQRLLGGLCNLARLAAASEECILIKGLWRVHGQGGIHSARLVADALSRAWWEVQQRMF